jgi:AcrR family transcriptional regulator
MNMQNQNQLLLVPYVKLHKAPMKGRQIDPQEKIKRVVKAARKLFVDRGYFSVSIPEIVKTSGVSTGAIYSYFPNKESLAHHIHEQTLAEFHGMFCQRLAGRAGAYEKLKVFAELVFDLCECDPEMMEYMLFMKHGEFIKGTLPLCFTDSFKLIRQIVAKGIKDGELKNGDDFLSSIAFTGVILRAAELRLMCVLEVPLHEAAEELMASAWSAICARDVPTKASINI